jgi:hypothetical protein
MRFWRKKPNEEESEKKESIKHEYFEVERPSGDGRCSDDLCSCGQPGVIIPRGTGYLYIPKQVVDFRRDARSLKACREKMLKIQKKMGGIYIWGHGTYSPIMGCKQAATLRGLDLNVAAADAKYWWETGLVPLRATPLVSRNDKRP